MYVMYMNVIMRLIIKNNNLNYKLNTNAVLRNKIKYKLRFPSSENT